MSEGSLSAASSGRQWTKAEWTKAEKALRSNFLFGTTSGDEFRERVIPPEGKAENMQDVLMMGQKDGKYMKYARLKEPGWGRKNTRYAQQFGPKPLTDFESNLAMKLLNAKGPPPPPDVHYEFGTTTYGDEFSRYDSKKMKGAKQATIPDLQRSKRAPFTQLSEGLLRSTSTTEEQFVKRAGASRGPKNEEMFFNCLRPRPDGLLETYPLPFTTSYTDDFGIPRCGSNTASTVGSSRYGPSLRSGSLPSLRSASHVSGSQHASSGRSRASQSQRAMSEAEWSRKLGVHENEVTRVATAPGV